MLSPLSVYKIFRSLAFSFHNEHRKLDIFCVFHVNFNAFFDFISILIFFVFVTCFLSPIIFNFFHFVELNELHLLYLNSV